MAISGSSFCFAPLPIFAGEDYTLWQKKMETFFMSQDLWNLVQNGKTLTAPTVHDQEIREEERKDLQALYYIQQAVTPTIFSKFVSASSAKTAWDFLEKEYNTKFLEDIDFRPIEITGGFVIQGLDHAIRYIREVEGKLRDLKPAVYTPQLISIGPLHHGKPELANMQIRKLYYAKRFLNSTGKQKDLFVDFIKQHEQSIRLCYYGPSDLSSRAYVEMILLDSLFILEFLDKYNPFNSSMHDKYRKNILVDLMLFENQLPLSLLLEILKIAFDRSDFSRNLTSFSYVCSENFAVFNDEETRLDGVELMKQLHFTGLVRRFICRGVSAEMKITKPIQTLRYAARKLSESNVKFFGIVGGSFTDIIFKKRVLNLPKFTVDNTTERVYGNLIGLEQCDNQFKEKGYICSYILLLEYLIKNSDDVAVLVKDGVIVNELGSNQAVVDMFNRLCMNVTINLFYYADICKELNDYCSSWSGWWNYCRKLLKYGYFTNIWRGTATIAAVILLFLTLTQTITSIMQVM